MPLSVLAVEETEAPAAEEKNQELESIRQHIEETEVSLKETENEMSVLEEELRDNELASGRVFSELQVLEKEIARQTTKLDELQQQRRTQEEQIRAQQGQLGQQIRAAYISGRVDYLKLLLNQEDPARVGRVIAYYDYHNRSRTTEIQKSIEQLESISRLEQEISQQRQALEQLKQNQIRRRDEYDRSRQLRQSILVRLRDFHKEQGEELTRLKQQEVELTTLLQGLPVGSTDSIRFFEDIPPFKTLRGKLQWPVSGKHLHRFGAVKKGHGLKWQGILIEADAGTEVKAVGTGKVVFADWFKNMGLLIIIDHGDGYMSLYGHNQNLHKKPGDWVLAGESIALVGDSGGLEVPALYFEIRQDGEPQNPSRWCKK